MNKFKEYTDLLTNATENLLAIDGDSIQLQGAIKHHCQSVVDAAADCSELSKFLIDYVNQYFPADFCRKGNALVKRFNTVKKTLQEAGRAEHRRDHYIIRFSGGTKKNPARTVEVELRTEAQQALDAKRADEDKAREQARAEEDKALQHAAHVQTLEGQTTAEVVANIAKYFNEVYGDTSHTAADIATAWAVATNQADDSEAAA